MTTTADAPPSPSPPTLVARAIADHTAGRFAEAEAGYRAILAAPDTADQAKARHGLGLLKWQTGDLTAAQAHLEAVAARCPEHWHYPYTLGQFFAATRRPELAIPAFLRAQALQPDAAEIHLGLADALHAVGRLEEAIAAYRQTLARQPANIEALNNLGVALDAAGQREEAISLLRHGVAQRPDFNPLYSNLGNALLHHGEVKAAVAVFEQGLGRGQQSADLWFNYGNALATRAASPEAVAAYEQALALDPLHLKARVNLANTFRLRGEIQAALGAYRQVLAHDPNFADAHNNMGVALLIQGESDAAIAALEQAAALAPNISAIHNNLGNAFKGTGQLDAAVASYRRAVALNPHDLEAHGNLVYTLSFHPDYDDPAILVEARRFAAAHPPPRPPRVHPAARRDAGSGRRLNVGYLSPDFRNHCQALFTMPLFSHHDRERFKIHCYAQLACGDAITERLAAHADLWHPIYGLSDPRVAERIEADGIDILVDLTMHMANGRPLVFACKPAPVQVAWLAYPGTTGLPAIDYRLTDPWLDPPGVGDDHYAERSIRLPDTFWCYDPLLDDLHPNPLPARTAGHVTFGCLNNFCKVSDATLDRFGRVLARVPGSRLLLLATAGSHRRRVWDCLGRWGISPERIEFVSYQPRPLYLQTYHRIDLCLDTLPYNGHTTSLDAYWMGVPVVTQVGGTVAGRAGWSQLNNLGLTELAAFDERAFVDVAVALANDWSRLAHLRATLRGRLQGSPLMDGGRFARAIETIYWRLGGRNSV
ncbi:MAG: tetratricopeptide repeat protein [Magnetococcales bacterium]|nr:tetratricopeptide repeat protein [Magnetococcales bacterium]